MFLFYSWVLIGVLLAFIAFLVLISFFRARRRIHNHSAKYIAHTNRTESHRLSDEIRERRRLYATEKIKQQTCADENDDLNTKQ